MQRRPETTEEWLTFFQTQQTEILGRLDNLPCVVTQTRVGDLERWRDKVNTSLKVIAKITGGLTVLAGLGIGAFGAWKAFWS